VTTVGGLGEAHLIELIKPYISRQAGGDDAAVLDPAGTYEVISTDMSVEGVHFDLSWMSAEDAGWRALGLALGDLAAKGALPVWTLAALAVPLGWMVDDFVGLFKGMRELASRYALRIEGGDLSAIDGPAVLSLTVGGYADMRPVPRSAAEPGWAVAVTGPLGAAAAALRDRRVLRPQPLIEVGVELNELGLCCGDIADGLVRELDKFRLMAGVGYRIDASKVPIADGASLDDALSSGEEVQLICVGPPEVIAGAGLTLIGELNSTGRVDVDGIDHAPHGYDHFA
jgi:thiamine-monophosphate kinase